MTYKLTDEEYQKKKAKAKRLKKRLLSLRVELNGTDENPWHRLGFTQNPIPQLGTYEYDRACLHLQALGGDPIPDANYIRNHLKGWSDEFIDLCCGQFRKGEIVRFEAVLPEDMWR